MMTHDEIRARLLAAMDRSLDPDETDEVERHVAACPDCRLEQVELHRMRRSLDREDLRAERLKDRPRWGPLGGSGLLRVLILGAFTVAALAMLWRRHAGSPAQPPPASAWVQSLGSGVMAGPPGRMRPVADRILLAPGDSVSAGAGVRALVALPGGARVVLEGPASGALAGQGAWRPGSGHALAEGPLRLEAGPGALVLSRGLAALWDAESGLVLALVEGEAAWEGAGGSSLALAAGGGLRLDPGAPAPRPEAAASLPPWVEDLRPALGEADADVVIPGVRMAPEGAP